MSETETIEGTLEAHRVVAGDFFAIATMKTDNGPIACVGKFVGAKPGDSIEAEGFWNTHPTYGRQFKVSRVRVLTPQSDNGVIAWLTSRLPNIGEGRARAMLDHFDGVDGLWKCIEKTPERLSEVKGITSKRAEEIAEAYAAARHDRDAMIKLRRWGLTDYQISNALRAWITAQDAVNEIGANPYAMIEHVSGVGFLRADAIAQRMGIAPEDVARLRAGITYTMQQATGHGHVYVSTGKLVAMSADKVLRVNGDLVAEQVAKMKKAGTFVQHGKRTFARYLNNAERKCADKIRALLAQREE